MQSTFILGDACPEGAPTQVDLAFFAESPRRLSRQARTQPGGSSPKQQSARKKRADDAPEDFLHIVDALREAHRHAMVDTEKYLECELAVCKEKERIHSTPSRASELQRKILLEPREAAIELEEAREMRSEAMELTQEVRQEEQQVGIDEQRVAFRLGHAKEVSMFFGHVNKKMDGAHDVKELTFSNFADDRRIAYMKQEDAIAEAQSAQRDMQNAPAVRFELSELKQMLWTEERSHNDILEGNSKINEEINEVNQGHPCPDVQEDCDRLIRELRSLRNMTLDGRKNSVSMRR